MSFTYLNTALRSTVEFDWVDDGVSTILITLLVYLAIDKYVTMPRLSLYKPERGNDYRFIDRQASEMFQAGGTDVYLHKYIGPTIKTSGTADQPVYGALNPTNIQDLLFLENRDRKYDTEIYRLRGHYNVANIDFNLSQFGLFIDSDTIYMTVHINDIIRTIGRKPISGDVFELPHLRDDFALNEFDFGLPRYYVISDVGRATEGFSSTWYPHLYRLKCTKIVDSQQFADILNQPAQDANGDPVANTSLKDLLSTYNTELGINQQVVAQAEADAPKSGYETRQFYTLAVDPANGKPLLETTDLTNLDASNASNINAATTSSVPERTGYTGYLVGDGFPSNGYEFGFGIQFPSSAIADDFFLRTDFMPNRLFRFDGARWMKVEDSVRMTMTQTNSRSTLKTSFINNTDYTYNDAVGSDTAVTLAVGDSVVNTRIPYTTSSFVVLKLETYTLEYAIADYPGMLSSYRYVNPVTGIASNCVRVTLPVVESVQQTAPFAGKWLVTLYNTRESQRSSLSQALKPRADL
jgi:hypothetical protein